eukprot:3779688-Rhodomonas_salina.1
MPCTAAARLSMAAPTSGYLPPLLLPLFLYCTEGMLLHTVLRICYALCGTAATYAATRFCCGTPLGYAATHRCYELCSTDLAYAATHRASTDLGHAVTGQASSVTPPGDSGLLGGREGGSTPAPYGPTLRNQIQETALSVRFVLRVRFLVFDFGVYAPATRCLVLTEASRQLW